MSQPLIFSDDEDVFSKQLIALDISKLISRTSPDAAVADKENLAWRVNDRVKTEVKSEDTYSFHGSPGKRPDKIIIDSPPDHPVKEEPLDEDENIAGQPDRPVTPGNTKREEDEEWALTPSDMKTPLVATSAKRRRMLRKIKKEMAEEVESKGWDRNEDPDFVFVGEDAELATPTPFRLRSSSRRRSRVSYRNLDWSSETNDRKRNRVAALLIDESEEERELARLTREAEREERKRIAARKRTRTQAKVASLASSTTVPESAFSISDDDSLALIAKRAKVEEEQEEDDEDYRSQTGTKKGERRERSRRQKKEREGRGESASSATVPSSAFSQSDDDSLAQIQKRIKEEVEDTQEEEEDEGEEEGTMKEKRAKKRSKRRGVRTPATVPDAAFSLATIRKRIKVEEPEESAEGQTNGLKSDIKKEVEDEEEEDFIKRRKR